MYRMIANLYRAGQIHWGHALFVLIVLIIPAARGGDPVIAVFITRDLKPHREALADKYTKPSENEKLVLNQAARELLLRTTLQRYPAQVRWTPLHRKQD